MLSSTLKKKREYHFELTKLPKGNLDMINTDLDRRDKLNILLVCKEWFKSLLPIVWEYTCINKNSFKRAKYYQTVKKNVKYIKCLDINLKGINKYGIEFPNLERYEACIYNLPELIDHFGFNPYSVCINFYTTSSFFKKLILEYELQLKQWLENVKDLYLSSLDESVSIILPIIASSFPLYLTELYIYDTENILNFYESIINKLDNLKFLRISWIKNQKDLNVLFSHQFINLIKLELSYLKVGKLVLELDNFPKLNILMIKETNLVLEGKSYISKLLLDYIDLKLLDITKSKFIDLKYVSMVNCVRLTYEEIKFLSYLPSLKSLSISGDLNLNFKSIYSLFCLPQLTCFNLFVKRRTHNLLLLDEVYPKISNNILSLTLRRFELSEAIFKFILKYCKQLKELTLINCKIISDRRDIKELFNIKYTTNLTCLSISNYTILMNLIVEIFIQKSPNLKTLKLSEDFKVFQYGFSNKKVHVINKST